MPQQKTIIVTAGPTNERIDDVMKITNMSTGALGSLITETILNYCHNDVAMVYYISPKLARKPRLKSNKLTLVEIESANDLLREMTRLLTEQHIDIVIHNAAVGDYKARYSIRAEDLADELGTNIAEIVNAPGGATRDEIRSLALSILTSPKSVADSNGKMSSYEPNLMTMMDLTPKVIGRVKRLSPDTILIGSKLLDGVTDEELFEVSDKLADKNGADYVIANDLARIGNGLHWAMIVHNHRIIRECRVKQDIANAMAEIVCHGKILKSE